MPNAKKEENVTCKLIKTPNLEYYSNIEQFSKNMLEIQKVINLFFYFQIMYIKICIKNFRLENK